MIICVWEFFYSFKKTLRTNGIWHKFMVSPKEPHPLGPRCEVIKMVVLMGDTVMWSYLSHKLVQIRGINTLRYTTLKDGLPSHVITHISMV